MKKERYERILAEIKKDQQIKDSELLNRDDIKDFKKYATSFIDDAAYIAEKAEEVCKESYDMVRQKKDLNRIKKLHDEYLAIIMRCIFELEIIEENEKVMKRRK